MADQHSIEEQDGFERGFHGIPDDGQIRAMSYIQLSEVFHSCEKDSTKFHVIEREVKRRLAKDQAEINRPNMLLAACLGGVFALAGVLLGHYLAEQRGQQVSPASAVQQIGNGNLTPKPQVGNAAVGTPEITIPAPQPAPVASNAGPGNRRP